MPSHYCLLERSGPRAVKRGPGLGCGLGTHLGRVRSRGTGAGSAGRRAASPALGRGWDLRGRSSGLGVRARAEAPAGRGPVSGPGAGPRRPGAGPQGRRVTVASARPSPLSVPSSLPQESAVPVGRAPTLNSLRRGRPVLKQPPPRTNSRVSVNRLDAQVTPCPLCELWLQRENKTHQCYFPSIKKQSGDEYNVKTTVH